MTREEAIKWIKYHINTTTYEQDDELLKALEMAIKALKQEPCDNHEEKPHSLLDAYFQMRKESE